MKNTIKIAFAIVFCLMLGVAANAQTISSGTVDFNVTVAPSFDIRSGGAGTGLNGMVVSGGVTANNALSATVTVADASPNIDNSVLTASVPIRLRSNAPYKLNATRTGISTASATDFESSDIAMNISFVARSGAQVEAGTDNAIAVGNVGALSATAFQIANGARISTSGNTTSPDNFITANLNFSAPRAFYTPTPVGMPYQDQVTISILAP